MIDALTKQINYAGTKLYNYGHDHSGLIEYKFNSSGFRSYDEYTSVPELVFAGGSISFGIGVAETATYKHQVATFLNKTYWDLSYASEYYDNELIYNTLLKLNAIDKTASIVIQWVSDLRNSAPAGTLYSYIQNINEMFPNCLHFYIDGRETKQNLNTNYFDLINPVWLDSVADNTHPGIKTHNGISKFIIKKINEK